ncbi:hypothetical protein CONCODRAFT_9160 [Conidiobolus coronatus NRRL 28638]|uniref:Uncharacterized protein n=1 Tax=Conidiobolus coronatus (strain ATCC 28846 / CBS 209.66 / NRRL 28638) TaxID=796925 RepID=A0A137P114_CONC2|nr:hypothetical protein CONCODRAFT_9160 [Conidiobolus coronatus NRRL 28638]|eukprot:KXN68564.1 hypothetical protein CONCODRAFT_9160 [Conidiobolus coronatus NRRL 28638]
MSFPMVPKYARRLGKAILQANYKVTLDKDCDLQTIRRVYSDIMNAKNKRVLCMSYSSDAMSVEEPGGYTGEFNKLLDPIEVFVESLNSFYLATNKNFVKLETEYISKLVEANTEQSTVGFLNKVNKLNKRAFKGEKDPKLDRIFTKDESKTEAWAYRRLKRYYQMIYKCLLAQEGIDKEVIKVAKLPEILKNVSIRGASTRKKTAVEWFAVQALNNSEITIQPNCREVIYRKSLLS